MELCQWQHGRVRLLARDADSALVAPRPLRRAPTSVRRATVVLGKPRRYPRPNCRVDLAQDAAPGDAHAISIVSEDAPACGICFEPARDPLVLEHCRHAYCRTCLGTYLRLKILRGNVYPLCCRDVADRARNAAASICGREVAPKDVARAVPPDVWRKYQRFKLQRDHRSARECPHCAHLQVFDQASAEQPVCVCGACGRTFCFVHSAAHAPDDPCERFERAHAALEAPSRAEVARIAKPCPTCGSDIEKAGGCDHMCCAACSATFCWLCGAALGDGAAMRAHKCSAPEEQGPTRADGSGCMRGWSWSSVPLGIVLLPFLLIAGAMYVVGSLVLLVEDAAKRVARAACKLRRGAASSEEPSYL